MSTSISATPENPAWSGSIVQVEPVGDRPHGVAELAAAVPRRRRRRPAASDDGQGQ